MKGAAGLCGRMLHGIGVVVVGLLFLIAGGAAMLAWRLSLGPMDVAWAVRAALNLSGARNIQVGEAMLTWAGWQGGAESPVRLVIRRLDVTGSDGATQLTAREGNATLSTSALLKGQVVPSTAEVRGAHLRARRDEAGKWHLALGDVAPKDGASSDVADDMLDQLRRLSLKDATLDVDDARLGPWHLSQVAADLTRDDDGGLHGEASADVALANVATADVAMHVSVQATVEAGGASRIALSTTPSNLAALAPGLGDAAKLDAPVTLSGVLILDRGFKPATATVTANAGPGRATVGGGTIALDSIAVSASLGWTAGVLDRLDPARVELVLPSPGGGPASHIAISGSGRRLADHVAAQLRLDVDRVAIDDLPKLWPPELAPNARSWIVANITTGVLQDGHFSFGVDSPIDLSDLQLVAGTGRIHGRGASVHWLRPVPPVDGVAASVVLTDPDTIDIVLDPGDAAAPGRPAEPTIAGPLTLGTGRIRLAGLSGKDQSAGIDLDIAGSGPATVALLRHPRLKLLSKHPPPFRSAEGRVAAHLHMEMPLKKELDFDDIPFRVDARLTRLKLVAVVAGKDLTDGDATMHVTNDGLTVKGAAAVAGLPGTVGAMVDFRGGPPSQVMQSVTFATRPGTARLAEAGAPIDGVVTGSPAIAVSYLSRRSGVGEVSAEADLTAAGIDLLGWRKAPGPPARLNVHAVLDHDRLAAIDVLRAEGPGLSVQGRGELAAPGRPAVLVIDGAQIGATRASGRIVFGTPLTVTVTGPVLDVSSLLATSRSSGNTRATSGGAGFVADAAFGRVLLGPGREMAGVAAHVESDGRRIRRATLGTSGPERLAASITPAGQGRDLVVRTADAGALLRVLDVTGRIEAGAVTVAGRFDDTRPGSPLSAMLSAGRIHILGAPSAGKILQAITVYGIADALRGPGLVFASLDVPFRYAGDRLDLVDARLVSASLGATATGSVDFGRHTADIAGTIVPFYILNAAPGLIPLVGRLLTAERGGGLFAATYRVRGKLDDPSVGINPFTLLAPGLLRRLFEPDPGRSPSIDPDQ